MAAITNPGTDATEFSGKYKIVSMYNLALTEASDTMTLTAADNGISTIQNVLVCMNGGQDAEYAFINASFSDLVVTIEGLKQDGVTAADDFTGTTCNLLVIGY